MFCPNCGNQLPDDAGFCGNCGTRLNGQPTPQANPAAPNQGYMPYAPVNQGAPYVMPKAPKKNNLPLLIGIIAGAVALIVLLVVLLGGGGGNGNPEDVAEKFFNAVLDGDFDAAEKCVHPKMWEDIGGDFSDLGDMMSMFGDSIEISVEGKEDVTKEEKSDVQDLLDEYDINDKLGKVYAVELSMTVSMFGEKETDTNEVLVAEIDGDYYVINAD